MSGVKRATVQRKLDQALEAIHGQIAILEKHGEKKAALGVKEYQKSKEESFALFRSLKMDVPASIAPFVQKELAALREMYDSLQRKISQAESDNNLYLRKDAEANQKKLEAQNEIKTVERECKRLENSIRGNYVGYLDAEDQEAKRLRTRAQDAKRIALSANSLLDAAEETMRKAHANYLNVIQGCREYQQEYDRLLKLGGNRLEAQRIAEEEERTAKMIGDSLSSLAVSIEALSPEKFFPGEYDKNKTASVSRLIRTGEYKSAIAMGQPLVPAYQKLLERLKKAKEEWLAAKNSAELAVKNCLGELALFDKQFLLDYSGVDAAKIEQIYAAADGLNKLLEEERFLEAAETAGFIMEAIRKFGNDAMEHKNQFDERQNIANVIMQALCDADYYSPEFGYAKDENGNIDKFGPLSIFASSPGGVADMKMQIGLDGHVKLEVENVSDGNEGLCINALNDLAAKVQEEGIDFHVTDWGRAENKLNQPNTSTTVQTVTKEQEQKREKRRS